jgi:tetratricopeptide (TPR) repeat protein
MQEDTVPEAPPELPVIAPEDTMQEQQTPDELGAFVNYQDGLGYFNRGRYDSAYASFQRAVQISPENAAYRRYYGLTLLRLGAADEAASEFMQALRLDPTQPQSYALLGDARLAQADTAAALSAYLRFMEVGGTTRNSAGSWSAASATSRRRRRRRSPWTRRRPRPSTPRPRPRPAGATPPRLPAGAPPDAW